MAQPPAYSPAYDFSDYQETHPADPLPADRLDIELAALQSVTAAIRANLALIQRDDGNLANLSVTVDTLSAAVVALIGSASGWTVRGSWVTATSYAVSDVVSKDGFPYVCATAHTSGTFATDLAAGKWVSLAPAARTPFQVVLVERDGNVQITAADKAKTFRLTGTFTQTFAAAADLGRMWSCDILNAGSGTITLDASGSETFTYWDTSAYTTATTYSLAAGKGVRLYGIGSGGTIYLVIDDTIGGAALPTSWYMDSKGRILSSFVESGATPLGVATPTERPFDPLEQANIGKNQADGSRGIDARLAITGVYDQHADDGAFSQIASTVYNKSAQEIAALVGVGVGYGYGTTWGVIGMGFARAGGTTDIVVGTEANAVTTVDAGSFAGVIALLVGLGGDNVAGHTTTAFMQMNAATANNVPFYGINLNAAAGYSPIRSDGTVFGLNGGDDLAAAHGFDFTDADFSADFLAYKSFLVDGDGIVHTDGVKFPATQVASADANTLDDYEEGTWTPSLTYVTPGDLAVTYSTRVGLYTKIGNKVTVECNIITSAFTYTTASGDEIVSQLPFTQKNVSGSEAVGTLSLSGVTKASYTHFSTRSNANNNAATFNASASGQAEAHLQAADAPSGTQQTRRFTLTYFTA